jgi:hypothetical protein
LALSIFHGKLYAGHIDDPNGFGESSSGPGHVIEPLKGPFVDVTHPGDPIFDVELGELVRFHADHVNVQVHGAIANIGNDFGNGIVTHTPVHETLKTGTINVVVVVIVVVFIVIIVVFLIIILRWISSYITFVEFA